MAHPIMFDADDPVLAQVRQLCLALPEAHERVSHGHPTFAVAKLFAAFGGGERLPDGNTHYPHALLFIADPAELPALDQDPRFFLPAYYGPSGWRGVDLDRGEVEWDELAELVETSYRTVANKRQLRVLEESR